MANKNRPAREVFDDWASDYHADGMEREHWNAVNRAFSWIAPGSGNYLEVGVGNGYGIFHMASNQFKNGRCYGLDVSPEMIRRAREKSDGLTNVTLESGDFLTWKPEPGILFDTIFSMEVFYYFHDIQAGIDHAAQLLKPGGKLMVLVNFYQENPESHTWPEELNTHMTLWSEKQYRDGFTKAGLISVELRHVISGEQPNQPGTLAIIGEKRNPLG